jgi:hypothetical protein
MKRGIWADHVELLRKRSRLGVIRVSTLEQEGGVPSRTSYRRCLSGGPWRRLLPGIVVLQNGPPSRDQLVQAALLYAGPAAVVSGLEACRRHGLDVMTGERVHVLVPHDHKLQSSEYLLVERTRRMPCPVHRNGIPLAPLVRAVLDSCRRTKNADEIVKLLIEAIQKKGCDPSEFHTELELGSPRGTAMPRRLLGEAIQLRSVAEKDALTLTQQAGLATEHWNKPVYGPHGAFIAIPDAWWDDVGFAWEIDSKAFHYKADDYANTLARNAKYAAAGIVLLQTLPSRLRTEPKAVMRELADAYRAAANRPRPPVYLKP